MSDVSEKPNTASKTVSDWVHGAVDNAYARNAIDFVEQHKGVLEAAGVAIVGTVAIVGGAKFGAFEKTAALIKSVVSGEGVVARGSLALGESVGFNSAHAAAVLKDVDTYVFDMDRTLVDTTRAFKAYKDTLHAGITRVSGLPPETVRAAMDATETKLNTQFYGRRLDLMDSLKPHFPSGLDFNWKFNGVAKETEAAYHAALQPSTDTIEMLEALKAKDKNLILFTAGSPIHTAEKLDATGLGQYFDKVYTNARHPFEDLIGSNLTASAESRAKLIELSERPKAGVDGYRQILRDAGVAPKKAAMTGDHIDEDVARAKKVGMKGLWATWYARSGASKVIPDLVLTSPEDLTRAVADLPGR
ncbi:MAG TPA: HAD family hydrolase [Oculatellaceae cyanobacterium]